MASKSEFVFIDDLKKKYSQSDTTNFDILDFLSAKGSPLDAVMYLRLFWPEFIRFEGMVFRSDTLADDGDRLRVRQTLNRYGGDRTRTEKSINILDVPCGIFGHSAHESSDHVDVFLVERLVELWACRLAMVFPDQETAVEALDPCENGEERGVVFYTRRLS